MIEPPEDAIRQVCEFAGLDPFADRQLVISALRANGGNVEAVLVAYYDGENKFRQTYAWTESSFIGDRDDTGDNPDGPSYTINATDESILHGVNPRYLKNSSYDGDFPYLESAPPSHPPSRVTSPVPRNISGWINDTAHLNFGAPSTLAQEDEDLERALAESAAMSGIHTPQETGATGTAAAKGSSAASTSHGPVAAAAAAYPAIEPQRPDAAIRSVEQDSAKPHFGPANRAAYNTADWAMTRIEPISKDAKPSARTRPPNAPAFLGSIDHNYLNAILTVLHSIPVARNALLSFGGVEAHTYGNNPEWWKSTPIYPVGDLKRGPLDAGATWINDNVEEVFYPPPSVDRDPNDKRPVATLPLGTNASRQFIEEVQRLMAFLDGTERSYAYTDNLESAYVSTMATGDDTTRRFCNTLSYFGLADFNNALFTEVKMLRQTSDLQETLTDQYMLLDLNCNGPAPGDSLPSTSLYHMLDQAFWTYMGADLGPQRVWEIEDYKTAVVSRLAPVQMFRVNTSDNMTAASYLDSPYSLRGIPPEASGLKETIKNGAYARPHRIEFPETLYMDRYVEENQKWALEQQDKMRMAMLALCKMHAITSEVSRSSAWAAGNDIPRQYCGPLTAAEAKATAGSAGSASSAITDKAVVAQKLSALAMTKLWNYKADVLWRRAHARNTDFNSADVDAVEPETAEERHVFDRLRAELAVPQKQMQAVRKRMGQLQAERVATWKLLTRLRSKRTVPTEEEPLKYKYRLRGVVVSSKRFYMCRRELVPEDDVINLEDKEDKEDKEQTKDESMEETEEAKEAGVHADEEKAPPAYRDQWWLVMHRDESTFVQKVALEVALTDARTAGTQVVLAYCTDEAWTAELDPLSDALKTFVKHDNRHFKKERDVERAAALDVAAAAAQNVSFAETKKRQQGTPVDDYHSLLSPIKRRHQRSSSADSMASNASVRSEASRASSVASDNASASGGVQLNEYEMEDMPLLSRQDSAAVQANANMPAASNRPLQQVINEAEFDKFNSEASSEGDGFDDVGPYKDAMMQEALFKSIADAEADKARQQQREADEKEQPGGKESEPANKESSPLGTGMVDLAISPEVDTAQEVEAVQAVEADQAVQAAQTAQPAQLQTPANPSDSVMQEQVRVPKEMQYPKAKDKQKAGATDGQFSTGVQLLADWDNPEGRYVPDEMDES